MLLQRQTMNVLSIRFPKAEKSFYNLKRQNEGNLSMRL